MGQEYFQLDRALGFTWFQQYRQLAYSKSKVPGCNKIWETGGQLFGWLGLVEKLTGPE
jgi:hypothetical protein